MKRRDPVEHHRAIVRRQSELLNRAPLNPAKWPKDPAAPKRATPPPTPAPRLKLLPGETLEQLNKDCERMLERIRRGRR